MNAKNIWILVNHALPNILWDYTGNNEWNYIGLENDFKFDEARKIIDRIFTDEQIYFVINRHSAKMLNKIDVSNSLKKEISKNTIIVCNEEFDTMIEFNKLGVYRIGHKNKKEKT